MGTNRGPLARVAVAGVATLALAWSAWTVVASLEPDAPAAASGLSPVEARQREILEAAINRPGDPELGRMYADINARHFGARLPTLSVAWDPALEEVGQLAAHAFRLEGMFGVHGDRAMILMHPHLASDQAALRRALVHEMVHAFLHTIGENTTSHGPRFQAELQRLSSEHAFEGIVATDAERTNLRTWLDDESARLATDNDIARREGAEIDRERLALEGAVAGMNARVAHGGVPPDRAALEALQARQAAYNRLAAEANARAERRRRDIAELNRQIARYNLMLAYPDGLDHEPFPTAAR